MASYIVVLLILALAAAFAALGTVSWRLYSRRDAALCTPKWLKGFSLESYAPMERLLDPSDLEFLASQPGYSAEIGKRLIRDRRRIFATYLERLVRDFNQVVAVGKWMIVNSAGDRPEFASALWREQIAFYWAVCVIRCKVALYPWGWTPVDVPMLLLTLERLRDQIRRALPEQLEEASGIS